MKRWIFLAVLAAASLSGAVSYRTAVQAEARVREAWDVLEKGSVASYVRVLDDAVALSETGSPSGADDALVLASMATQRWPMAATLDEKVRRLTDIRRAAGRLRETLPPAAAGPGAERLRRELDAVDAGFIEEQHRYNEAAVQFNAAIRGFPNSLIAPFFGHFPRPLSLDDRAS